MLSDADGIKLSSDGIIQIIGAEVRFEAPTITCSAVKGELMLVKMDAMLPTPESSFLMSSSYQMLSHSDTTIEGTEVKAFDPYPDQPVEGSFDWGGLIGNVLAGLAVVALVAVAIALTIGTGGIAGAAILGACVVGTVAVVGKGYGDYQSGTVSDTQEYINIGFKGAVAGAVCATLPSGTGMLGIGTMSLAEGLVERTIMGEATAWSDILVDFGVGAFGFGILDNINRKFKLTDKLGDCIKKSFGKTAKKTAAEAAEKATKEAAEKASKKLYQPDKTFEKLNTNVDDVELPSGTWDKKPTDRGKDIDVIVGNDLGSNYPVVDKFDDVTGTVTSIKSRDVNCQTYQNGKSLENIIKKDIDKLYNYQGASWGGSVVKPNQINAKQLQIVVPNTTLTKIQIDAINSAIQYGKDKGIVTIITIGR